MCSNIVLLKDAGLLFAFFLAVFYMINYNLDNKEHRLVAICVTLVFLLIPKLLWQYELRRWDITNEKGSVKFSWRELAEIISGKDTSYKRSVFTNYFYNLSNGAVNISGLGVTITYIGLLVVGFSLFVFVLKRWVKQGKISNKQGVFDIVCWGILSFVYIFGLFVTYISNFSEYEASGLASYERYQKIFLLAFFLTAVGVLWFLFIEMKCHWNISIIVLILLGIPYNVIFDDIFGVTRQNALDFREPYIALSNKIKSNCDQDDAVWVISEANNGIDKWVIHYNVNPVRVNDSWGAWSLGEPQYDGDVWTIPKSAEEWRNEILQEYNYVALYKVNDYFKAAYGGVFENPKDIENDSLFSVISETGRLRKVD